MIKPERIPHIVEVGDYVIEYLYGCALNPEEVQLLLSNLLKSFNSALDHVQNNPIARCHGGTKLEL